MLFNTVFEVVGAHFLVVTRIMACEIAVGVSPALFQLPLFHQNGQPEDLLTCFKRVSTDLRAK